MDGFYGGMLFGATEDKMNKLILCTKDMENKQVAAIIENTSKTIPRLGISR
jgi:hypothetical protein